MLQVEEKYIDLVHPETGEVIPTLDWVADQLLAQGWEKKPVEKTKKEDIDGKKNN